MPQRIGFSIFAACLGLMACKGPGASTTSDSTVEAESAPERITVVASTTMLADLAAQLGGDTMVVESIMSPGGDPHLYQPLPSDARLLSQSDVVVRNGIQLEGWIDDLLTNSAGDATIFTAGEHVTALHAEDMPGGQDPHFWFDTMRWKQVADSLGDALIAEYPEGDPARSIIEARTQTYTAFLDELHTWTSTSFATLPEGNGLLLTSHDAFRYLADAYAIEVRAIQGTSTDQAASQADVAAVVTDVRETAVPAIFVESSINPGLIEQVSRETGVLVRGPLYSDSIGAPGSGAETWHGMMVHNVREIVTALGGSVTDAPTLVFE